MTFLLFWKRNRNPVADISGTGTVINYCSGSGYGSGSGTGTVIKWNYKGFNQRWAKGPIVRSSDTDLIFRLYWLTQLVNFNFRLLYRAIE